MRSALPSLKLEAEHLTLGWLRGDLVSLFDRLDRIITNDSPDVRVLRDWTKDFYKLKLLFIESKPITEVQEHVENGIFKPVENHLPGLAAFQTIVSTDDNKDWCKRIEDTLKLLATSQEYHEAFITFTELMDFIVNLEKINVNQDLVAVLKFAAAMRKVELIDIQGSPPQLSSISKRLEDIKRIVDYANDQAALQQINEAFNQIMTEISEPGVNREVASHSFELADDTGFCGLEINSVAIIKELMQKLNIV